LDIIPTLTEMKCDTENVFKSQDSFKDSLSPSFYFIFGYFLRKCIQTLCWLDKAFYSSQTKFCQYLQQAKSCKQRAKSC